MQTKACIDRTIQNEAWIDRIKKEIHQQREHSKKWGFISETMYGTKKSKEDTKWTPFNLINVPSGNPLSSRPTTPIIDNPPKFKVNLNKPLPHQLRFGPETSIPTKNKSAVAKTQQSVKEAKTKVIPQQVYKYPPTTNVEYGWIWGSNHTDFDKLRKKYDIYGTTSAKTTF